MPFLPVTKDYRQRTIQLSGYVDGCLCRVDLNNAGPHLPYPSHDTGYGSARIFQRTMTPDEKPKVRRIGSIINQLMSRRGYASATASDELLGAVVSAIDEQLKTSVQVGNLRSGVLQIYATDSVTLQELNFQKRVILKRIQSDMPHCQVTDLRFRIQT